MFGGFKSNKLKPQLKMAISRIQIAANKKSALLKQNMREVAVMLSEDPPKEEKAKIRVESLIRDDHLIEAYEILQLECELLYERIKLLEYTKECPPDLVSVVSTLIWSSQRVDIPELMLIRKQFRAKYGKKFEEDAFQNVDGVLNERVVTKLSVEPPAAYLVQTYLERICEKYEVDWKPTHRLTAEEMIEPMAAPIGYSVPVAQGTGLGPPHHDYYNNNGGAGGGGDDLPPPIVTATAPYDDINNNNKGSNNNPSFVEPDVYVPPSSQQQNNNNHHNDGTTSTIGSRSVTGDNITNNNKRNDNDDDDDYNNNNNNNNTNGSNGHHGSSYADLAARFDSLKK